MTEPTDAELDTVLCNQWPAFSMQATLVRVWARAAMRDALAKWGTPPAVEGEPVAWRYVPSKVWGEFVYTEDPKRAQHARDNGIDVRPVFTAPQPTQEQAVAVPLTKEQAASLCKMGPVYAPDGQVVRTPEQYRRELEGAKLAGIRTAERAHGIKGGQHGAE